MLLISSRWPLRLRIWLALLWLPLAAAAQTSAAVDTVWVRWGEARRFEIERALAPGHALELCAPLRPAQAVDWTFHASDPLAFQLFHRLGKRERVAERRARTLSLQGRHVAEQELPYCWRWRNPGSKPVMMMAMLRY